MNEDGRPDIPAPPEPNPPYQIPVLGWGVFGAALIALVLIFVLWRRRAGSPPPDPTVPASDPGSAPLEPLPDSLAPAAPQVMQEIGGDGVEPLRAIPADSTEWMEGEELETEGELERPLRPVTELVDVLHTGDAIVCAEAVEELVRHGPAAVPALERALDDPDPDVRVDVSKALAAIRANEG
jgi:hypothetical protein